MLIRMHLKCIIQAFLYKYSSYLSQKIPTSWQCLHTMLNPTSRAHALWVILHLKTLVPFRVLEDVYPTRILVEFSNNTLCYHSTSSSTKKLQVFSCSVGLVFNFFFFFPPNSAFPPEHLWGRNKRICTNPFYMNQIFMLCPLEVLSSSNLWNVISWPQHSGTSKSAALWAVLERPQRIFICLYHRHTKTLWPSCGILCYKALVQSVLWERGMLWLSHVYGTIRCRVSPGTGRMMNHAISTFKPASAI